MKSFYWTAVPLILGFLSIFIYSQVVARKEIKLREKGFRPKRYQDKLASEYTKKEKYFTLLIAFILLLVASLSYYLLINNQILLATLTIWIGIAIWRLLLNLGNSINK